MGRLHRCRNRKDYCHCKVDWLGKRDRTCEWTQSAETKANNMWRVTSERFMVTEIKLITAGASEMEVTRDKMGC